MDVISPAHRQLVKKIAIGIFRCLKRPHRFTQDDLIAAGLYGLVLAWQRYDPQQNDCFEAYATRRIRGEVVDWVRKIQGRHKVRLKIESLPRDFDRIDDADTAEQVMIRSQRVQGLLSLLPGRQREVIDRIYLREMTLVATANDLRISPSLVYKSQQMALRRMRDSSLSATTSLNEA